MVILIDSGSILEIIKQIKPDEIYNLAAQSHVGVSFKIPNYTTQVNAIGTLNILDSIKKLKLEKKKILSSFNFRIIWRNSRKKTV